jgi:hypothetical protein
VSGRHRGLFAVPDRLDELLAALGLGVD